MLFYSLATRFELTTYQMGLLGQSAFTWQWMDAEPTQFCPLLSAMGSHGQERLEWL